MSMYVCMYVCICRGIYCCCNYRKWQKIEEEREAKREKLIAKTRRPFDPTDRVTSYGTVIY